MVLTVQYGSNDTHRVRDIAGFRRKRADAKECICEGNGNEVEVDFHFGIHVPEGHADTELTARRETVSDGNA